MEDNADKNPDKVYLRLLFKRSHIPLRGESQSLKEQNTAAYIKCLEVDYKNLLVENGEIHKLMEANEKIFLKTKAELCKTNLELEKIRLVQDQLKLEMAEKESCWNRDKYTLLKEREALLNEMSQMVEDIKHLTLKNMELVVRTLEDENTYKVEEEGKDKDRKDKKSSLFGRMMNRFISKTTL